MYLIGTGLNFLILLYTTNMGVDKYACIMQMYVYIIATIQNNDKYCPEYSPE